MSHLPVPEINKRQRDDATEALIREALEEEQQRKKAKKGDIAAPSVPQKKPKKGQTLREIEESEGGPVKESMVGMAAVQRALRRKKKAAEEDETALPDDIAVCEEEDDDDDAAAPNGDGDVDMFDEEQQQQQARQKRVGGRKVPKGISAAIAAAMEGSGGYAVTKFNMNQEREEGNIDEEGNFVPAQDDDETQKDAWLNSDEAKVVSDKVAAAAAARQAAMDAADEAPSLSETAVAKAQLEVSSLLLPGESVTEGLRRLAAAAAGGAAAGKGKALGKREKQRLAQQQQQQQHKKHEQPTDPTKPAAPPAPPAAASQDSAAAAAAAAAAFTRLTELADLLLNAGGELGVYSNKKEQLERFAKAVLPQTDLLAPTAAAAGGDDDDMFADDDGNDDNKGGDIKGEKGVIGGQQGAGGAAAAAAEPSRPAAATAGAAGGDGAAANGSRAAAAAAAGKPAPAAASASAASAAAAAVDYSSWPVKELRRFLTERGVDSSSIVEKGDLVAQVKRVADKGPISKSAAAVAAPAGYNYDCSSGYYYSTESELYWDAASGAFYNSSEQKWYEWDEAGRQFKEVAGGS